MNIKPIRSDEDLQEAFQRLDSLFHAEEGTPEADEMEILFTLNEAYKNKNYPIAPPESIDAIRYGMDQQGLSLKGLQLYYWGQRKSVRSVES